MADIRLKVSPDVMRAKAGEISNQIARIENNWNRISDLVENSKFYWQGDAGDIHRKYVKDNAEDVRKMLQRLREHPEDLQKMAGIYVEAESKASQLAQALPSDVIT